MTVPANDLDTESLKKEIKQELLKREIMMGLEEDEIDLFELGKVLLRSWRLVFVFPFIVAVCTAAYSWFFMPNFFKAQSTIFVHTKGGGLGLGAALGSLMGGLGGLAGGGGSAEYLVTYLKSDTLSTQIINRFNIATNPVIVGDAPNPDQKFDDVLKTVNNMVSVSKDKDGLITISVETRSASLSAEIAHTYVDLLQFYVKGPEKQKRLFIEGQLEKVKKELEIAELDFKSFQDQNKVISVDEQGRALIEKLAKLEASRIEGKISLTMHESLLKAMGNLPELVKIESQKVAEQAKQQTLEKEIAQAEKEVAQVPALALDFGRKMRELRVKEKVFATLTEQYEMAKITETEEGSKFEIIDRARAPERKSKPKRALITIMAGITAGMLGVFLAFFLEFLEKRKKAEEKKRRDNPSVGS